MMKTLIHDGAPRKAVVLHGVSYVTDLGYRELLEEWERTGAYPVTYVPTVSRATHPENVGWTGRTGRVEAIIPAVYDELGLTPENSIAYICGNPDMILSADETLLGARLPGGADQEGALLAEGQGAAGRNPGRARTARSAGGLAGQQLQGRGRCQQLTTKTPSGQKFDYNLTLTISISLA